MSPREALHDFGNIARYTRLEVQRAYRDVGPYTAAHVAVAVPAHLLRLWWRDKVRGESPERADRGQADVFPMWLPAVIGALIAVIIMLNLAGVLPP